MWGVAGENLKVETRVAHTDWRHYVLMARDRVCAPNFNLLRRNLDALARLPHFPSCFLQIGISSKGTTATDTGI